jgi:hypothetical protein
MTKPKVDIKVVNFIDNLAAGLIICAGGFEDRSITFIKHLSKNNTCIQEAICLHYESQKEDNELNYNKVMTHIKRILGREGLSVSVNADMPVLSYSSIKTEIEKAASKISNTNVIIDISGMTNQWSLGVIDACLTCRLNVSIAYTEAKWYYPSKGESQTIVAAWENNKYERASPFLQSAGLKAVHILPEFGGNFRPGKQTCLVIFAGYEPNRTEGLVDDYAPGALIVYYGKSPHKEMRWRTELSRSLHNKLFSNWLVKEIEVSTFDIVDILDNLERQFGVLKDKYDIAIAPQCSKMQAIASYFFWRSHPEVQLVFTSPVRFNPARYSRGSGPTYLLEIHKELM